VQKPTLFLFLGYPGAGKTTAAQFIQQKTGAELLWADFERRQMFVRPTYSAAENDQLYSYLDRQAAEILNQGKSVVFDTNFNFLSDRDQLRKIASRENANAVTIWVTTPKAVAKKRAVEESQDKDTRVYGNMTDEDFERIASHLEEPTATEEVIKIDGTDLDNQELQEKLNLI
jgi:predicted kinase